MDMTTHVNDYIKEHWKNTVHTEKSRPEEIELPYPYSVPCENQRFTYFFYWDTYFINIGLLYDMPEQALNNLRDIKFLIDTCGFMPNANLTTMLNRSQPTLFCSAVYEYCARFPSENTVREFYPSMVKEYEFWMSERILPCGLNRYASSASANDMKNFVEEVAQRGIVDGNDAETEKKVKHLFAEAESGWDFSPRFNGMALCYAPVDLNSMLYKNERILSEFAAVLGKDGESEKFARLAEKRKSLINGYMKGADGFYYDYNYTDGSLSSVKSVASLLPYWAGADNDASVCKKLVGYLEFEYGLSACAKSDGSLYQWDYPNMWPPLVEFAVSALRAVGADNDAKRLAEKYISTITRKFESDGCLYEKYSAVTGECSHREYDSPKMLGWTGGVFRKLYELYIKRQED